MKTLVRYSFGRAKFTGRIPRVPFAAWAASPGGRLVVEGVQSNIRFSLFGRRRAAQRRIWRRLNEAARNKSVVDAMQREIDAYLTRLDPLVYAHDLPRASVDLRRLVVVPRSLVNSAAYRRIVAALDGHLAPVATDDHGSLLDWFVLLMISGMEAAVVAAQPSPRRSMPAGSDWVAVGVNERFEWGVPLEGPAWLGHYYVLELTSTPVTRAVWKGAEAAISNLEAALPSLSRVHRNGILRAAGLSIEHFRARA
jgi:hypothetical protein